MTKTIRQLRKKVNAEKGQAKGEGLKEQNPSSSSEGGEAFLSEKLANCRLASCGLAEQLEWLDPYQLRAVLSHDKFAMVQAGVGSGKTTVLVMKVLYLHVVRSVPLDRIAVLTFTNRAAGELRLRLERLGQQFEGDSPFALTGTFHSVCKYLLEHVLPLSTLGYTKGFDIIDDQKREELWQELIVKNGLKIKYQKRLHRRMKDMASGGMGLYGTMKNPDDITTLIGLMEQEKRSLNAMDFDDLLESATSLLMESPMADPALWIVVDELQDCDQRQLDLIGALSGEDTHYFMVGDPSQRIYSWRGGCDHVFQELAIRHPGCVEYPLPVNYRSTINIIRGAGRVLNPWNTSPMPGVREWGAKIDLVRHHNRTGEAIYLANKIQSLMARGVSPSKLAVLYRLKRQAEAIREAFDALGIPHGTRGLAARSSCAVEEMGAGKKRYPLGPGMEEEGVHLLTFHAAKGLEFDQVFISGANRGLVPLVGAARDLDKEAEERRLFFVALTRARDRLEIGYVTLADEPPCTGEPSPYLSMLPSDGVVWWEGPPDDEVGGEIGGETCLSPGRKTEEAGDSGLEEGDQVRSDRYGVGEVVEVCGERVVCQFPKVRKKTFSSRFCPLSKIG